MRCRQWKPPGFWAEPAQPFPLDVNYPEGHEIRGICTTCGESLADGQTIKVRR